VAVHKVKQILK